MTGPDRRLVRRTRPRPRPAPAPGSSLTRPAERAAKPSDELKTWVVITPDETDLDYPNLPAASAADLGPDAAEQLRRSVREDFAGDRTHDYATGIVAGYVERGRPFSLYLRNFGVEAHKVVKPSDARDPQTRNWSYFGGRSRLEERLGDAFQPAIRMIGVANPADPVESGVRFPRLDVVAPDWERIVGWLIQGASFIVFDLDTLAPGVSRELNLIAEQGRAGDTAVVLPGAGKAGSRENPYVQGILRRMGGIIRSDPAQVRNTAMLATFRRVATEDEIRFDALATDPRFGELLARHERELARKRDAAALRRRARFIMTLGLWDHASDEPGRAIEEYLKAEKLFAKAKDPAGQAELLMHMGRARLDLDLYEQAIGLFKKSGTMSKKYGDKAGFRGAVLWVGIAHYVSGDPATSAHYLVAALKRENLEGRTEVSVEALRLLERIYREAGHRRSADNAAADLAVVRGELAGSHVRGRHREAARHEDRASAADATPRVRQIAPTRIARRKDGRPLR
jgi:tetratricopeptide (TPR) repeat protein